MVQWILIKANKERNTNRVNFLNLPAGSNYFISIHNVSLYDQRKESCVSGKCDKSGKVQSVKHIDFFLLTFPEQYHLFPYILFFSPHKISTLLIVPFFHRKHCVITPMASNKLLQRDRFGIFHNFLLCEETQTVPSYHKY